MFVKRRKIDQRNSLLEKLKEYQLSQDEIAQLHSTSAMQTAGLKKFINEPAKALQNLEHRTTIDQFIKRKRRRRNEPKRVVSSSEDTDEISTDSDTDEYYQSSDNEIKEEVEQKIDNNNVSPEAIGTKQPVVERRVPPKPKTYPSQPAINVPVSRLPEIEAVRLKLPIINEEQKLIETIRYNDIVIISGQTGSGKTTQLPQFLYEAGYALNNQIIGITEPRRVAAISMSERVAKELNLSYKEVSYQIRFAGNVSPGETRIKFMTDGVLLKECQKDLLLSKYSVIIIDEAHERSVSSDILIGLLSRIVPLRAKRNTPLKLVIMSATLRVSDFTENRLLFKKVPPVINIDSRQFPVSVRFKKRTPENYLEAAFKKVCFVHSSMPRGGILVFVTSQMDVKVLVSKLKSKFVDNSLHCLGLYAMLPLNQQQLIFKEPQEGKRLCVVATNVAETSITIPNIKYVVDTGLEKTKVYNMVTGISKFITTWTSKSSAEQRMGRAGRMGPGQCYRLYSSAVYTNEFPEHSEPLILRKPVEDVMLQMKSMNIDNVVNFPFPTRPTMEALMAAEKKLLHLGALDDSDLKNASPRELMKRKYSSKITALGKAMSRFSVGARCSKMIVLSPSEVLPHVISLVSALTVREMFLNQNECQNIRSLKKKLAGHGISKLLGDFGARIRAVREANKFCCKSRHCIERGLRPKAMLEIDKLRKQLTREVHNNLNQPISEKDLALKKLTDDQCNLLRQLLLSSYSDHLATKISDCEISKRIIDDSTKIERKKLKNSYECKDHEGPVYISSDSVLKGEHPDFVIFGELYQGDKGKTYMRDVATIDSCWLKE